MGLLGVPTLLWVLQGQKGVSQSWVLYQKMVKMGCGLGIFDLMGGTRPSQHVGLRGMDGAYYVYPLASRYKESNNGDNIACVIQSLGMLLRNFRPCGRQRTP